MVNVWSDEQMPDPHFESVKTTGPSGISSDDILTEVGCFQLVADTSAVMETRGNVNLRVGATVRVELVGCC